MKGMPLKYSTARSRGKRQGSVQGSHNGFFSCLFSSDHNNCSGWATALQPNPLADYTVVAGGSTRGREIKKKEGEKGTCFLQVCFVFIFNEGIGEVGVGGQRH